MYCIREATIVTTHLARSRGSLGGGIARNGGTGGRDYWDQSAAAPVWRGCMADVWKYICTLVSILRYHAHILHYIICLTCKHCHIIEFTLIPRSTRPVQGSRPEVPPRDLTHYSSNAASGQFSHPNPSNRMTSPYSHDIFPTIVLWFSATFVLYGSGPTLTFHSNHPLDHYSDHWPKTRTYMPGILLFFTGLVCHCVTSRKTISDFWFPVWSNSNPRLVQLVSCFLR
jgi:hypothetical protein